MSSHRERTSPRSGNRVGCGFGVTSGYGARVTTFAPGSGLRLDDVVHAFGDHVVLDGVTMDAAPGVITGLLGPNGAGKTTLLRALMGVVRPLRGTLTYEGEPVTHTHRSRWGYMPQERGLYQAMPAGEQVVHFARLHGLSHRDATARARQVLEELGLADRWSERTDRLSGGQQQRLQLATTLVHNPEVMVLDEPFAGLDPVAVDELSASLRRRAREGRVVLFSSHQLDLVQHLCERIVMIDDGRTVVSGEVAELRARSPQRQLRIRVASSDRGWLAGLPVTVVVDDGDVLRLALAPGADALAVLDAARAAGPVTDFGLDLPTLSQIFREALNGREPTGSPS